MAAITDDRATGWQRTRFRLQVVRREPTFFVGIILTIILLYLVVAPIISILWDSMHVQFGDSAHALQPPGAITSYYFWRAFRSSISNLLLWEPLAHTMVVAIGTTLLTLIIGGPLAWLLVRTNVWGKKWLSTALIVPYMLPSWTFALAWLTLFKNRQAGGQLGILEAFGFDPPDWLAYGQLPIIICLGLHYFPFVLLLVGNALQRVDAQLEDSARMLGAPRRTVLRRIVAPLMLPALMSSVLLVFGKMLGTFGTPYILGLPVRYDVLSTSLYSAINSNNTGIAAVLTLIIVVVGVSFLFLDSRLLKEKSKFVTVGAKGAMNRTTDLRRWRRPAFAVPMIVFLGSVIVPVGALLLSTVTITPGDFSLDNFTLKYWFADHLDSSVGFAHGIFRGPELWTAAWNSIRIIGIASLICGFVGLLIGYAVVRSRGSRMSGFLRQAAFLPYLVPGIAFAAAYISLFAVPRGPMPALYGTFALLIIVLVVTHLPYSSRSGISAMMQLGTEPEEAAQVAGARWWKRIARIVVPIQKGALTTGIILPFISGMKELSVVIMLTTSGTQLLTTLSIDLVEYNYTQLANATILIVAAVAFGITYLAQKLMGSNISSGLGG